jgi:hypothetical protein
MFKVLVGCEESQTITGAFRDIGIEAFSCDIKKSTGAYPEYHFKLDIFEAIDIVKPDLLIANPPCTYLTSSSSPRLFDKNSKIIDIDRYKKGLEAKDFFMRLYDLDIKYIALENPTPIRIFNLPDFSQMIQPYYFGDAVKKRTCLWLKNLPLLYYNLEPNLFDTNKTAVKPGFSWVVKYRSQTKRSKSFNGIAKAMATQWTDYILNNKNL